MKMLMKDDSGIALVFVLIFMAMLLVIGTASLDSSLAEKNFSVVTEYSTEADIAAHSGAQTVADYLLYTVRSGNGYTGKTYESTSFLGGTVSVQVNDVLESGVLNTYVESTATINGWSRTAKIKMNNTNSSPNFLFTNAIIAESVITNDGSGNGLTITGDVMSTTLANIQIDDTKINGTKTGNSDLGNVLSSLIVPPETYDIVYASDASNFIVGNTLELDSNSGVDPDNLYVSMPSANFSGGDELYVSGNGTVHIYLDGDLTLDGNSSINVEDNVVSDPDDDAALCIYKSTPGDIIFNGAATVINNTFIFAPNADVDFNNNNASDGFYGAVIANTVNMPNIMSITHVNMEDRVNINSSHVGAFYSYTWID